MPLPDCDIQNNGDVSGAFLAKGISTFANACLYVKRLAYGRNENKDDILSVFKDGRGTCSTKHALLKRLAEENGLEIDLVTGIYCMTQYNTPGIGTIPERHGLQYLPEAHCYLKAGTEIFDFTFPDSETTTFKEELLEETIIGSDNVINVKATLHKSFLRRWLLTNNTINLSLENLWEIREACIAALSRARSI